MQTTEKHRLLIVDDSRETVIGLRSFFSSRYDVVEAYNGSDGMRLLEAAGRPVDLVIADLVMPGISGAEFISIIKARFPGMPVIVITGWMEDPEQLVKQPNADLILYKPFELEILDGHVQRLLEQKR